jgi:DNA-binding response OmpR family regulator
VEGTGIVSIRVLLADDDLDFLDVTAYALRRAGFVVRTASNGDEALSVWRAEDPDLVLLDVSMPARSGIEVCETICSTSSTPVVLLSGARREADIIRGLEVGADDYITKPFSVRQLVMRLRAIHRRATGQKADVIPKRLVVEPLVMDLDSFSALIDNKPVQLTLLEFRLLYYLAANVGRVVPTALLVDFAWGLDREGDGSLLKTHISHIRRKLQEVFASQLTIRAFPGVGYSLQVDAAT